jgi:hypothetical protein
MAFSIDISTGAPTSEVLQALRGAADWRESALPDDLRSLGVHGTFIRLKERRFVVGYEYRSVPPPVWVELRGIVTPLATGGSRLQASVGLARGFWKGPLLVAAIGVWVWPSSRWQALVVLAVAAALSAVFMRRHAHVTRDDTSANTLADRVEAAVRAASAVGRSSVAARRPE